ncbi:fructose-bisphosphatase class III [Candidatus Shapirobacteria bacterium]|nr:fructose-bisphosphatase class III [Candidatus Shapirobacteria bacterium]
MSSEGGELPAGVVKEAVVIGENDKVFSRQTRDLGFCQALEGTLKVPFDLKPSEKAERVRFLAEQAGRMKTAELSEYGSAQISIKGPAGEANALAVLNVVKDKQGQVWLYSNLVGNQAEGNHRLEISHGLALDGETRIGPDRKTLTRMGLGAVFHLGLAIQVIDDDVWVVDLDGKSSQGVQIDATEGLSDRIKSAGELPYSYENSLLTPPTLFKAGSEGWILVSINPSKPSDVILAKVCHDRTFSYKSYPSEKFRQENKINEKALAARLKSRYFNPDAEPNERTLPWSYGGEVDGSVILFRSFIEGNETSIVFTRLSVEDFEGQRVRQEFAAHIDGKRREAPAQVDHKPEKEFYEPKGVTIEENTVRCRKARILPDIHAGHDPIRPWGSFLDNLEPDEVVVFQELIDRGMKPWEIVDKAMEMVMKGQGVYVLGNHETMFLSAMTGNIVMLANWLVEGGDKMLTELNYPVQIDKNSPFGDMALLNKIRADLESDSRLEKVREFNEFLIENGKIYAIVNGMLVVHAGIPADTQGNLLPMPGVPDCKGLTGIDLLDALQRGLSSNNKELIAKMNTGEARNPFWMREPFFVVAQSRTALHALRAQLNWQLAQKYPDGSVQIEAIVLGHTPGMVDNRSGTRSSLEVRALFIDGGFSQTGEQRVLLLSVPDSQPDQVQLVYKDPSGEQEGLIFQGVYPLH